ncbi:MAG: LPS export ABC transporter periplasmic protein LptC, partial [Chitinophagaceae bacterium]
MKSYIAKLFCLLAFAHLFLLVSCGDDDLKNAATISAKQLVLSKDRSYGVDIVYSDSAKVKAKGYAPILDKVTPSSGSMYNEMPKGVKIEFFDELMKKTGTITSDYAINKVGEKITIFRKHVVVVSPTITFTTEELIWDENKKLYTSPYGTVTG